MRGSRYSFGRIVLGLYEPIGEKHQGIAGGQSRVATVVTCCRPDAQ
jgi:hypothetical protein